MLVKSYHVADVAKFSKKSSVIFYLIRDKSYSEKKMAAKKVRPPRIPQPEPRYVLEEDSKRGNE